jgi:hypothetical protein
VTAVPLHTPVSPLEKFYILSRYALPVSRSLRPIGLDNLLLADAS